MVLMGDTKIFWPSISKRTMGKIRIVIEGLNIPPPDFQIIDLNKPLIPTPKQISFVPNYFILPKLLHIASENLQFSPQIKKWFEENLKYKNSFELKFEETIPDPKGATHDGHYSGPDRTPNLYSFQHFESYFLTIDSSGIRIEAEHEIGLFYALTSLSQLIHLNQHRWVVQSVKIFDYPTLATRACALPSNSLDCSKGSELHRWLTYARRYKYNQVQFSSTVISSPFQGLFPEMIFTPQPEASSLKNTGERFEYNWFCPYFDLAHKAALNWNLPPIDTEKFQRAFIVDFFGMYNSHLLWELVLSLYHLPNRIIYDEKLLNALSSGALGTNLSKFSRSQRKSIVKNVTTAIEMFPIIRKTLNRNQDRAQVIEDRLIMIHKRIQQ